MDIILKNFQMGRLKNGLLGVGGARWELVDPVGVACARRGRAGCPFPASFGDDIKSYPMESFGFGPWDFPEDECSLESFEISTNIRFDKNTPETSIERAKARARVRVLERVDDYMYQLMLMGAVDIMHIWRRTLIDIPANSPPFLGFVVFCELSMVGAKEIRRVK